MAVIVTTPSTILHLHAADHVGHAAHALTLPILLAIIALSVILVALVMAIAINMFNPDLYEDWTNRKARKAAYSR